MRLRDLTGQTFGRWYVIERAEDYVDLKGNHYVQWKCQCQCKNKTIKNVTMSNLTRGISKSCGCLQKELVSQRFSGEPNKYDLSGEYGIGWTNNTNREFYFDLEDYDKIKDYCWFEHVEMKTYNRIEAYNKFVNDNKFDNERVIALHYLITGKKYQDHINRNPLDNRKENLRDSDCMQNSRNKSLQRNNTSGVAGVTFSGGKWLARVNINKKQTEVYRGDSKEEAIKARLKAEKEYYGEFAPQQHLYEQYGIT